MLCFKIRWAVLCARINVNIYVWDKMFEAAKIEVPVLNGMLYFPVKD